MYVKVHAQNGDDDRGWELAPGKSICIETDKYSISPRGDDLLIKGEITEKFDTGDRDGEVKMVRRFVVNLSKQDVEKIAAAGSKLR